MLYRPDGVNTVTVDEKERFEGIKDRLRAYLSNQITHFRYVVIVERYLYRIKTLQYMYNKNKVYIIQILLSMRVF